MRELAIRGASCHRQSAAVSPAPYTDRGAPVRFRRGATTEGSRGLQPTVEDQSGRRRGATLDDRQVRHAQASLRDAGSRRGQPWAEAHGYRHPVAPRPGPKAIRVRSSVSQRPAAARTNVARDMDLDCASLVAKLRRLIPRGAGHNRAPLISALSAWPFASTSGLWF